MKKLILLVVPVLLISNVLFADVYEMDISDSVINFSSYCKPGKVTMFIISIHRCTPCKQLYDDLLARNYDTSKVDIYHCLMTKDDGDVKTFKERESTKMWGYLLGITSFPVLAIYGPTGDLVFRFDGYSPEIFESIDALLGNLHYYNPALVKFGNKKTN